MSEQFYNEDWYFGDLSRQDSEELLRGSSIGTYLVRKSKQANQYAISLMENGINHYLIYYIPSENVYRMGKNQLRASIQDFLDYYSTHNMTIHILTNLCAKPIYYAKREVNSTANESRNLSVSCGDSLQFHLKAEEEYLCTNLRTNQKGWISIANVESAARSITPSLPSSQKMVSDEKRQRNLEKAIDKLLENLPAKVTTVRHRLGNVFDPDILPFERGEKLTIIEKYDNNIEVVAINEKNQKGNVPINFLNLLDVAA